MRNEVETHKEGGGKKWTGKHVLGAVVVFFGVIFAANIAMVTVGIRSFPGEDTKQSYRQGLAYNETIAARNTQNATGWNADITLSNKNTIVLKLTDKGGIIIRGLRVTGSLKHLAETDKDSPLKFAQAADGTYIANIDKALLGKQWVLTTSAKQADGTIFNTRNKIWLK
ncbi:MAG: FixH family protein [Robiginitomaculum sp.]|nr:FixH family protein [Robiginitomaculum sp.]